MALSASFVLVLLTSQGRFVHQSALGDREHRHSLVILATGSGIVLPTAGTSGRTGRADSTGHSCSDGHRTHPGTELEIAVGEFIEGALVLEKNDLTVRLTAPPEVRH